MPAILNIAFVSLAALFLSIPVLNENVFHTVDIDAIRLRGTEMLGKVQQLQKDGKYEESRDSARVLVEEFRNDTLQYFTGDVYDWNAFVALMKRRQGLGYELIAEFMADDMIDSIRACSSQADLTFPMKMAAVTVINRQKNYDSLYIDYKEKFPLKGQLQQEYDRLAEAGIFTGGGVNPQLSDEQEKQLRRFHMDVLEKHAYGAFIEKRAKRGTDWASEFIVQSALYLTSSSYSAQFQTDEALRISDSLIKLYPQAAFAEQVFLTNGKMLIGQGKNQRTNGEIGSADESFERAIGYLKKIEMNREVAREFPKYKYTDLQPGTYVNIDEASKAKRRIKQKTEIYTSERAKEELEGGAEDDESGYVLEDAVRLIGEAYTQLGRTDSARMQFSLILDFFPESENIDDAQKLIADSYIRDGDLALEDADSSDSKAREEANEFYAQAVKEYQKFINVYPQSDLISTTYISMGDAYNKLQQPEKAKEAFELALAQAKDTEEQAKIQLEIGNYYNERKRYEEAAEAYSVILNNFINTQVASNAQYLIGECYESLGDTTKAIEAFTVIVEHYKQSNFFGGAAYKIGNFHFDQGNYKEALKAFKTGFAYEPDGRHAANTQFQCGAVWQRIAEGQEGEEKQNSLKEAIKEFKIVAERWPDRRVGDQANFQIAKCFVDLGNENAAREATRNIASRDILINTIKLFGIEADNHEEEINYWQQAFDDAVEDEERATALYEMGMVLSDKAKDYQKALETYQKSLQYTTDRMKIVNAKVGMARAYSSIDNYEAAADTFEVLLDNRKLSPELRQSLRIQLYDVYLKGGDGDKAMEGFETFAAELPQHRLAPHAFYRMGSIFAERKEHDKAIEKYEVVTGKYKDSDMYDKAVLGIGTELVEKGEHKKALEYLKGFMEENPNASVAAPIYLKIAEIYETHLEQPRKAMETYSRMLEDYSKDRLFSYAAYRYGMLLVKLKKGDEAKEVFEKVEKKDKSIYRAAQAEIGKLLAKTDPEAAIENYRAIVAESETQEDSATAMIGIGDVYVAIKKWEDAAGAFNDVYDFYTGQDTTLLAGALVKWVDALLNAKKYKEAVEVAQIMQKRFPENSFTINTLYYEANAYFSMGKYGKAREVFGKIIESDKSEQLTEIAYYQRADAYYFAAARVKNESVRRNQFLAAIRGYNEYIKKYPGGKYKPRALYMQGNAYWTLEDFPKAKVNFEKVINNYPDFGEICSAKNFLAYSLNKLDQWKAALKIYNQVRRGGGCNAKTVKFANEQAELIIGQH